MQLKEDRLKSIGDDHFTFYKVDLEDYNKVNEIFENEKPEVVVNLFCSSRCKI